MQECPLTDKHLLLMRTHGEDKETKVLLNDFIKDTDFYILLGIYLCLFIYYLYFIS